MDQALRAFRRRGVLLAQLDDQTRDPVFVERLKYELLMVLDEQPDPLRVVIDFARVSHVASALIGVVMSIHMQARRRGGQLRLCGVRPAVMEVFTLTQLDVILKIDPDHQTAIDHLSPEPSSEPLPDGAGES